jgi:hypothetical protein
MSRLATIVPQPFPVTEGGSTMAREQDNKAVVGRWFKEFWGNP